jgi:hypothetical protein
MDEKKTRELLDKEITKLKEVSVTSTNDCIVAEYIAISDKSVQEKFLHKISDGYIFKGIRCLSGISIPETRRVEFLFDCPSGVFCFIPPSFMVIVNMITKTVEKIVDPYLGEEIQRTSPTILSDGHAPWPHLTQQVQSGWGVAPIQQTYSDGHMGWPWATQSTQGLHYFEPQNARVQIIGPGRAILTAEVMAPNGCYHQAPPFIGTPGGVVHLPEQIAATLPVLYVPQHACPLHVQTFHYALPFSFTEAQDTLLIYVTVNGTVTGQKSIVFHRSQIQTAMPTLVS